MQSNEMVVALGSLFWQAASDWADICDFFDGMTEDPDTDRTRR
jgi:hypothetical protein